MRKFIVKIVCKLGLYKISVNLITSIINKRLKKSFKKNGLTTLRLTAEIFSNANAKMFLSFGTLLGAYREKNFIAHDFDLDVGVLAEQVPANIDELMQEQGFRKTREWFFKENSQIIERSYCYKGTVIDIFSYFKNDNDQLYCYASRRHEKKEWREANESDGFPTEITYVPNCKMQKDKFLGVDIYMPEKVTEWLTSMYGETYMTPIKDWDTIKYKKIIKGERSYRKEY